MQDETLKCYKVAYCIYANAYIWVEDEHTVLREFHNDITELWLPINNEMESFRIIDICEVSDYED